jgi:hypothetical protein
MQVMQETTTGIDQRAGVIQITREQPCGVLETLKA